MNGFVGLYRCYNTRSHIQASLLVYIKIIWWTRQLVRQSPASGVGKRQEGSMLCIHRIIVLQWGENNELKAMQWRFGVITSKTLQFQNAYFEFLLEWSLTHAIVMGIVNIHLLHRHSTPVTRRSHWWTQQPLLPFPCSLPTVPASSTAWCAETPDPGHLLLGVGKCGEGCWHFFQLGDAADVHGFQQNISFGCKLQQQCVWINHNNNHSEILLS